jgi:hypothetical protein
MRGAILFIKVLRREDAAEQIALEAFESEQVEWSAFSEATDRSWLLC